MLLPDRPTLPGYVRYWAQRDPNREVAVLDGFRLSYGELAARIDSLSRALLANGVAHGDRIAMLTPPHPQFLVAMLAATDIGATWFGLHPRYQLPELQHVIGEATPRLILAFNEIDGRSYKAEFEALRATHPCLDQIVVIGGQVDGCRALDEFVASGSGVDDARLQQARAGVQPGETAVIIFTSGTTGRPKGAMLSHRSLVNGGRTQAEQWPSQRMRLLQNMPPNHIACLGMSTAQALMSGGSIVFVDRFEPRRLLDTLERERITFFMHAPAIHQVLLDEPGFATRDLSALEYWLWGGAPAPLALVHRLRAHGARTGTAFGMTELGSYVSFTEPDASPAILSETIGRPQARLALRLADASGTPAPPGEQGEIQASGDWLLNGYFNAPQATRESLTPDGWFRTGDVAIALEDGHWRLVGRLKEMFKSGGFNVYPREVEIALEAHPDVAMAAVVGMPDARWHEVGHAFVQPAQQATLDASALDSWCRERLANYKIPKAFDLMPELPRLPIGKIDKLALKRELLERNAHTHGPGG